MGQTKRKGKGRYYHALTLVVVSGLILFAGWGAAHETRAEKAYTPNNLMRQSQEAIPTDSPIALSSEGVLRLHVKGNSNDTADQAVKLEVRDAIMAGFGETLTAASDAGEAEELLKASLSEIEKVATSCLKQNGFGYVAKAVIKTDYFPDRQYETATKELVYLPAGEYRALVVNLGKAEGDNWWCVMYPPLCYFDLVQRAVLKYGDVDGVRDVALIVDELSTKEVPVEVRSLLWDSLKQGVKKIADIIAKAKPLGGSASVPDK